MNFEEKVKSMSAHDIIMAMVEGLKNPVTKIRMSTYGDIEEGVCYECAATNTICKIGGYTLEDLFRCKKLSNEIDRQCLTGTDLFVAYFESAIDDLRSGIIYRYNETAEEYGFATIKNNPKINLEVLVSDYTEKDLKPYIELAKYQL